MTSGDGIDVLPKTSASIIGSCRRYPTDSWDSRVNLAVIFHLVGLLTSAALLLVLAFSICRRFYINFYRVVGTVMIVVSCLFQGLAFMAIKPMCRNNQFLEHYGLSRDYFDTCNLGPTTIYTFAATLGLLITGYSCFQIGYRRPDQHQHRPIHSVKGEASSTSTLEDGLPENSRIDRFGVPLPDDTLDEMVTGSTVLPVNVSNVTDVYTSYCMSSIGEEEDTECETDGEERPKAELGSLCSYSYADEGAKMDDLASQDWSQSKADDIESQNLFNILEEEKKEDSSYEDYETDVTEVEPRVLLEDEASELTAPDMHQSDPDMPGLDEVPTPPDTMDDLEAQLLPGKKSDVAAEELQPNPTDVTEAVSTHSSSSDSSQGTSWSSDGGLGSFYNMAGPPASMGSLMDLQAPGAGPATKSLPKLPACYVEDQDDSTLICLSDLSDDHGSPKRTPSGRLMAVERKINDSSFFRFM